MKLVIITSISEFEKEIKQILVQANVKNFSYKEVIGYHNSCNEAIGENWFGTEMNENESMLFYAFVPVENVDLICSTAETVVDTVEDYYVPDKNDLSKPIHLDDAVLFGTLFGHQKVFKSIDFKGGFAADSAFYERAEIEFKTKKVFQRSYIYYRNNPNSTCALLKQELLLNDN